MRASPLIVGIDDRPGWIRLASSDGRTFSFHGSSALATGVHSSLTSYVSDGAAYVVQAGDGTPYPGDLLSSKHRVLVHHALVSAGLGGQPLRVVTTLPAIDYFSGYGGRENLDLIAAKITSIGSAVRCSGPVQAAIVRDSYVLAQGVSAWADFALDDQGRVLHNLGLAAAVVEIGPTVTFCTTVLPGYSADTGRSGPIPLGIADFLSSVAHAVRRRFALPDVDLAKIRACVRSGFLEHEGKVYEVRSLIGPIQTEFVAMLQAHVVRRLGAPEEFYRVLFVGAGIDYLPQVKLIANNVETPEDPYHAGARGLIKYLRFLV